jgi:hypothetical protein
VFSEYHGFEGKSWTIQCEIIQHEFVVPSPKKNEFVGDGPPEKNANPEANHKTKSVNECLFISLVLDKVGLVLILLQTITRMFSSATSSPTCTSSS